MKCTYVLAYTNKQVKAEQYFDADDDWEALSLADRILEKLPFVPETVMLTTPDGHTHDRIAKIWSKRINKKGLYK